MSVSVHEVKRTGRRTAVIVGPFLLGLVFYGVLTPLGLALRLAGRDPMLRRRDPAAPSYWIARRAPRRGRNAMPRQS